MAKTSNVLGKIENTGVPTIKNSDRVFIAGKTGSGKSTLAEVLLFPVKRLIVIDSKDGLQSWALDNYRKSHLNDLEHGRPFRTRIVDDETGFNALEKAYEAGNVIIYIDELPAFVRNPAKQEPRFFNIWQRGRARNIGAWVSTQAPVSIPLTTLREAEHVFMFRLNLLDDRKRMSEIMGKEALQPIKAGDAYGFRYHNTLSGVTRYWPRLKI